METHTPDTARMGEFWYLYLAECADGTLYCGITTDPERRLKAHNGEIPGGAKYTRSRRPVRLAACLRMANRRDAASLEARLRKLPPAVKLARLRQATDAGLSLELPAPEE